MAAQLEDLDLVETDAEPDSAPLTLVDESNWRSLTQHQPIDPD